MRETIRHHFNIVFFALIVTCLYPVTGISDEVAKISKEELRSMLGTPEVVIIDVRKEKDWSVADRTIPGAYREGLQTVEQWAPKYPQDKTIVLYCT